MAESENKSKSGKAHLFQPGQSGNPGGRPVIAKEVRELAQQHAPAAIERLVELMHGDNPAVAVRAAEALLDRAVGKARQALDVEVGGIGTIADLMREIAERRAPESHPVERARLQ